MSIKVNKYKGHLSLKRYNALYFFSIVVDENAEFETENVVKSICEKFNIQYSENYSTVDSELIPVIKKHGEIKSFQEVYWSVEIEGIVEILYSGVQYSYISSNGIVYSYKWGESSTLVVNENVIEEDYWDQEKVDSFIEDIEILFSIRKRNKDIDSHEMFDIAWKRFEKGDKWKARDQMTYASFLIYGNTPDPGSKEYFDALNDGYRFIIKKWFSYLWECKESKKQENFILSLKEFISRNQEAWANTKENKIFTNRIYTSEHEEIKKQFLKEPDFIYKALWDLT